MHEGVDEEAATEQDAVDVQGIVANPETIMYHIVLK